MKIDGRLALITGASRGIGAATALALAQRNARLVLLARTSAALEKVAAEIARRGGAASIFPTDVGDSQAVNRVAQIIRTEIGIPDIIINNAGTGSWRFVEETDPDEAVQMMAAPYLAAFYVTRAFLPDMLERNSGHIVNVTSAVAYRAVPGAAAYSAACWAIRGFTEALRADLHGFNIGVTLFASGTVATPGFQHYPGVEERMPKVLNLVSILAPEQVAEAVVGGIEQNKREVIIPFMMRLLVTLNHLFPRPTEWLVIGTGWKHRRR